MKMKNLKSTICLRTLLSLLLLTALLISAFCLTTSAAPPFDDGSYGVRWSYTTADHTKLSGDGVIYEQVTMPAQWQLLRLIGEKYVYMNSPRDYTTDSEISAETVYSYEKGGHLVYVYDIYNDEVALYCESSKLSTLHAYFAGTEGKYVVRYVYESTQNFSTNDNYYDINGLFAEELLSLPKKGNGVKTDVTQLKNCTLYELRFQDHSGLLSSLRGAVYELADGSYGYVDYTTLDNSHFDADGNFSYRRGEVTVYPVDDFASELKRNSDRTYTLRKSSIYESNEYDDHMDIIGGSDSMEETAIGAFWFVFILGGYLLPIAPLVLGLVFAHSKKMSHPKRWYIVVGMAALWLVLAVLLTVLLLV